AAFGHAPPRALAGGGRALCQPGGDAGGGPPGSPRHLRGRVAQLDGRGLGRRGGMNPIALEGLTVRYGSRLAVDGVSLAVPEGAVYALLGRNGAGKSSIVRCLLGEQKPSSGRVSLLGREVWKERASILAEVGVVPEDPDMPPAMSPRQIARFCSRLYPRWDAAGVEARLKRFGVPRDTPFGRL